MREIAMVPRMLMREREKLVQDESEILWFNIAAFRSMPLRPMRQAVAETFERARGHAKLVGSTLVASTEFKACTDDLIEHISHPELGDGPLKSVLNILTEYRWQARSAPGKPAPAAGRYPDYNIEDHPSLVRYGIVELRVIENYLLEPAAQRAALERIVRYSSDEEKMYAPSNAARYLTADDAEWNLRRLMTNAGFYVSTDAKSAWPIFCEWADAYIAGLRNSHLAWHNGASYYFVRPQRALHERIGLVPRYLRAPDVRKIYANLKGRDVLFASPMAHIVQEQVSSGRLWQLYKNFQVPIFSVRTIPAWISTWPNRPHADWAETFRRMQDAIDQVHRERAFDVFVSSCGCYGVPISEYVRNRYGCAVLYVGNFAHTVFGIQGTQQQAEKGAVSEMWAKSDLNRYTNVHKIDGGRYI
jgi:hypothetical protein